MSKFLWILLLCSAGRLPGQVWQFDARAVDDLPRMSREALFAKWNPSPLSGEDQPAPPGDYVIYRHEGLVYYFGPFSSPAASARAERNLRQLREQLIAMDPKFTTSRVERIDTRDAPPAAGGPATPPPDTADTDPPSHEDATGPQPETGTDGDMEPPPSGPEPPPADETPAGDMEEIDPGAGQDDGDETGEVPEGEIMPEPGAELQGAETENGAPPEDAEDAASEELPDGPPETGKEPEIIDGPEMTPGAEPPPELEPEADTEAAPEQPLEDEPDAPDSEPEMEAEEKPEADPEQEPEPEPVPGVSDEEDVETARSRDGYFLVLSLLTLLVLAVWVAGEKRN